MKLLLLLIPCFAFANFIPESMVGTDNANKVFAKRNACEGHYGEACIEIPIGYNSSYHEVADEMIDDLDKPNYSKNEIEACIDEDDCQAKLEAKSCENQYELPIKTETEVYCSRLTHYDQIASGKKIVRENGAAKLAYDAAQVEAQNAEQAEKQEILDIKTKIESNQNLNNLEEKALRLYLLRSLK